MFRYSDIFFSIKFNSKFLLLVPLLPVEGRQPRGPQGSAPDLPEQPGLRAAPDLPEASRQEKRFQGNLL
jgi:hypothetical protein